MVNWSKIAANFTFGTCVRSFDLTNEKFIFVQQIANKNKQICLDILFRFSQNYVNK